METLLVWDYVVLGVMLTISASIGIYYRFSGGKQKTTDEYLLGDRNMSIIPVAFSLMAGFISAITLLGASAENYNYGTMFWAVNVGYGVGTPIVAYVYLPVFFRLQNTSVYGYLEQRFSPATRLIASLAYSAHLILYMGIVLYAPSLALEAVTGINRVLAILLVGTVCTFYSTIGGMKAVLIADVFQSCLMFIAVYLVLIKGTIDAEGFEEVWRVSWEGGRIEFDNISPDPTVRHTWWSLVFGGCFIHLTLFAVNQVQVQRLLTVKNLKKSQQACFLSWPLLALISISTQYAGLVLYHRYHDCDPITAGYISSSDQLMPYFAMESIHTIPALAGLFISGIFSGSLSTVSSALNSLAAISLEDYLKPLFLKVRGTPVPDKHLGLFVKLIALGYGFVCIAMAFIAQFLGGILQASYTIFGVVGGPLLGIFSLGMFTTFGNSKGAITGLVVGISLMIWIGFGGPRPPTPKLPVVTTGCVNQTIAATATDTELNPEDYFYMYRISYMWFSIMGSFLSFIIGAVVSLVTARFSDAPQKPVNPDYLTPWLRSHVLKQREREFHSSTAKLSSMEKFPEGIDNFRYSYKEEPKIFDSVIDRKIFDEKDL